MAIKDLEARQGNVNLTLKVVDKGEIREFEKFGRKGRVCNATVQDNTGKIKFTLWNDEIDNINAGDLIKIENGWVSEWQGELQLSAGKFGKIEVIEKSLTNDEKTEPEILDSHKKDENEHILTDDEKVEEEDLDELDEGPILEEEISDDEKETERSEEDNRK